MRVIYFLDPKNPNLQHWASKSAKKNAENDSLDKNQESESVCNAITAATYKRPTAVLAKVINKVRYKTYPKHRQNVQWYETSTVIRLPAQYSYNRIKKKNSDTNLKAL